MNDLIYDGPADMNITASSEEEEAFLKHLKTQNKCVRCKELSSILFMFVQPRKEGGRNVGPTYICLNCAKNVNRLNDWNESSITEKDNTTKCDICCSYKQNWCFLKYKENQFQKSETCIGCRNRIKMKLLQSYRARMQMNGSNSLSPDEFVRKEMSIITRDENEYNKQKFILLICNGCNERVSKLKMVGSIVSEPNYYYNCLNCASKIYAENRIKVNTAVAATITASGYNNCNIGNIQPSFNRITPVISKKDKNSKICQRCQNKYPSWCFFDEINFVYTLCCLECRKYDEIVLKAFKNYSILQLLSPLFNDEQRIINSKEFRSYRLNQQQIMSGRQYLIQSNFQTQTLSQPQPPIYLTFPQQLQQSQQLQNQYYTQTTSRTATASASSTTINNNNTNLSFSNEKPKTQSQRNKEKDNENNDKENDVEEIETDEYGNEVCNVKSEACKSDLIEFNLFKRKTLLCFTCKRIFSQIETLVYEDGNNYCQMCSAKYKRFSQSGHLIDPIMTGGRKCRKCGLLFPKWYFIDYVKFIYTEICLDCKNKERILGGSILKGKIKHKYKAADLLFDHYWKDRKQYELVKEDRIKCLKCDNLVPKLFAFLIHSNNSYSKCLCEVCAINERVSLIMARKDSSFKIIKRINQAKVGKRCNLCKKTFEEWCYIDENIEEYTQVCILCRVESMLLLKTDKVMKRMDDKGVNEDETNRNVGKTQNTNSGDEKKKEEGKDKEKDVEKEVIEETVEEILKRTEKEIEKNNAPVVDSNDNNSENNNSEKAKSKNESLHMLPLNQPSSLLPISTNSQQPTLQPTQQSAPINTLPSNASFIQPSNPIQQIPYNNGYSFINPLVQQQCNTLYGLNNAVYNDYQRYLLQMQQMFILQQQQQQLQFQIQLQQQQAQQAQQRLQTLQQKQVLKQKCHQQQRKQKQINPKCVESVEIEIESQSDDSCYDYHDKPPSYVCTIQSIPAPIKKTSQQSSSKYDYSEFTQLSYCPQKRQLNKMLISEVDINPKKVRLSSCTLFSISKSPKCISRKQLEDDYAIYTTQKRTLKRCVGCDSKISSLETFGSPTNKKPTVESNGIYLCIVCASKKYRRGIRFNRIIDKDPNGRFCKKCKGFYPTWVFINETGTDYYKNCIECRIREKLSKISDIGNEKNGVEMPTVF